MGGSAERAVFHAVNGLPGWLYQPMLYAQYLGVLAMPLVIAAGALVWRRWRLAAALVLVVPCKLGLERVAKLLVQRQRPGTTVPDAILRGVPHGGLSFTSGHAIITFAIAGLLVLVLPRRWGVLAIVLAVCNAVARVYLGAHNPLDVVGGAAIGLIIAAVLDLILDVARVHGRGLPQRDDRRGRTGPLTPGRPGTGQPDASTPRQKALTRALNRSGDSWKGWWASSGSTSNRAPGMPSATAWPWRGGVIMSRPPASTSVGAAMPASRPAVSWARKASMLR